MDEGWCQASYDQQRASLPEALLNVAVDWGRLRESPFKGVRLLREHTQRLRYLTEEEIQVLLDAVEEDSRREHLLPIIITALNTGMQAVGRHAGGLVHYRARGGGREIALDTGRAELTVVLSGVIHRSRGGGDYVFCRSNAGHF